MRVSVFDRETGNLSLRTAKYLVKRKKEDPDFITHAHVDHLRALREANDTALVAGGISGPFCDRDRYHRLDWGC